jgi:hypothetical protein
MKTPKYIEIEELEYDALEPDEIEELKETLNLDQYFNDYVEYEQDLTELIRSR